MSPPTLTIFGPLVLATDLLLLLGGEVIRDVKCLSDLFGGLALDHVGDGLASNIEKGLDVKIVGSKDDLEEHFLVDLHELLVPLLDVGSLLAGVGVIISGRWGIVLVMFAPLNDLLQDRLVDIGNGNGLCHCSLSEILHHVLDEHGALSDVAFNMNLSAIVADEGDSGGFAGSHCV